MRSEAQDVLEQANSAQEEAGRLGEAAWRAFDRVFIGDLPRFGPRLRMIREVDQARKAQAQLRIANNIGAWEEADRARQKATAELLRALTSVATAAAQVARELDEANKLPQGAEELRIAALEDLKVSEAIGKELKQLGQEALGMLGAEQIEEDAQREQPFATEFFAKRIESQRIAPEVTRPADPVVPEQQADAVVVPEIIPEAPVEPPTNLAADVIETPEPSVAPEIPVEAPTVLAPEATETFEPSVAPETQVVPPTAPEAANVEANSPTSILGSPIEPSTAPQSAIVEANSPSSILGSPIEPATAPEATLLEADSPPSILGSPIEPPTAPQSAIVEAVSPPVFWDRR